eukprot:GHVS01094594.1.p1 GENE.GHVS01094594.1~~GHVS01094594.1.p1  ORF type:complete len:471 (+),score=56.11 GHVS01094594.1:210-1622(+)
MWRPARVGNLYQWATEASEAVATQDGVTLAKLFRTTVRGKGGRRRQDAGAASGQLHCMTKEEMSNLREGEMESTCVSCLQKALQNGGGGTPRTLYQNKSSIKTLFVEYIKFRQGLLTTGKGGKDEGPNYAEVVKQGMRLLDFCMELYFNPKLTLHDWLVPSLAVVCDFVSKAAIEADSQEESEVTSALMEDGAGDEDDTQHKYTKEVLNSIRGKLGKCRGDQDKHGAYVVLLGQSIKGCIQLRNMQMAAGFLKAIETQRINYGRVPRSPMVSFRFYLGKLYMQQDAFEKAEQELVWAFSNSLEQNRVMRRNILECLVAVRLRMGIVPSNDLLLKYKMTHYLDIVKAVKTGDIRRFDRAMETHARILVQHGTILCLEGVKFIVYRTLMKQIKDWWVNHSGLCTKPHIVPIAAFAAGIKWQADELFDQQEMACICANLIRSGYVKGYISWEHMVVVFSSVDAFPSLRNVRTS